MEGGYCWTQTGPNEAFGVWHLRVSLGPQHAPRARASSHIPQQSEPLAGVLSGSSLGQRNRASSSSLSLQRVQMSGVLGVDGPHLCSQAAAPLTGLNSSQSSAL